MKKIIKITVLPQRRTLKVAPGEDLLRILASAGININPYCGGRGACGKCKVRLSKKIPTPTELDLANLSHQEINEGIRLACGFYPKGDEVVEILTSALASPYKLEMEDLTFPIDPWQIQSSEGFVMAVDVGTTNIVGHLVDPMGGRVVASAAIANGQASFGADAMTRLAYCSRNGAKARKALMELTLSGIENLAESLVGRDGKIFHVVAVMNTAMEVFLLGLNPNKLGRHPYESCIQGPVHISPFKSGLLTGTTIHIPPVIGGFVGSDAVSALLSVLELGREPPYLLLDMGTNAEVVVVTKDATFACSTAAGPAFEGAGISHGMLGAKGAIEHVSFNNGTFRISVIGNGAARGITGSGLFSLIGELVRAGALDWFGVMASEMLGPGSVRYGKLGHEVILAPSVSVSEGDVQQFILAKAATRAGVDTLLTSVNIRPEELTSIFFSGTFASRINPQDILTIGLVPPVELQKLRHVGNAAALGAVMMASSKSAFENACSLAVTVKHLKLSGDKNFKETFQIQVRLG